MDALTHIRIYTLTHFFIDVKGGVYNREKAGKEGFCIGVCRLLLGV